MICIRRNTLIEVINENGDVVAKALRGSVYSPWIVGPVGENGQINAVAEINGFVPEVLGRKLVIAMLKEFVVESEDDDED